MLIGGPGGENLISGNLVNGIQVEAAIDTAGGPATDADLADLLRGRDTWTVE